MREIKKTYREARILKKYVRFPVYQKNFKELDR
jgi:hypothetical protein